MAVAVTEGAATVAVAPLVNELCFGEVRLQLVTRLAKSHADARVLSEPWQLVEPAAGPAGWE